MFYNKSSISGREQMSMENRKGRDKLQLNADLGMWIFDSCLNLVYCSAAFSWMGAAVVWSAGILPWFNLRMCLKAEIA